MGIDWEELLGAEGDELQDAYEDVIDAELEREYESERWMEHAEAESGFYEQRQLTLYCRKPETREEQDAIRYWLNRQCQVDLRWHRIGVTDQNSGLTKPQGPAFLAAMKLERIVAEEASGRIVLLGREDSKRFQAMPHSFDVIYGDDGSGDTYYQDRTLNPYGLGEYDAVEWHGARPVLRSPYKFMNKYGPHLKSEYGFRGMPKKIVNTAKNDAVWWSRGKNYVWLQGEQYPNDEITWIFRRAEKDGDPILKPEEAWSEKKLIWLPV